MVCNDRAAQLLALAAIQDLPLPNQARLEGMRGQIPQLEIGNELDLGETWREVRDRINAFKAAQ